ncbi:hypothetical protein [Sulfurovum sp.]|uniref:hypothetical protein n=1 Tax=Sulfurovum sp. TaxID=1969726 RepID=UPI0035615F59
MNDNKNKAEEIIRNVEDEASEIIDEMIEEIENEVSESGELNVKDDTLVSVEEAVDEVESEVSENVEESVDAFALPTKAKKHTKAKLLVEKAKKIVKEANKRTEACKLLLETDLKKYQDAKSELKAGGFDACISLVKKLGYKAKGDEPSEETTVVFEVKEEVKPLVIKDVSSGKFTGLVYALIIGFITAVGLVYLATEKLEMTLNVTKVPSEDIVQSILAWFSTTIGMQEDVYIGTGVFGLAVLLVMILVYIARVSLKANSNLHFAVKQFVEAELYTEKKANCKVEMDKVDAHIKDVIDTLKTYEVVFNEQRGKLQRILYIEGEKEKSTEYHDKSYLEIRETKELISRISDFMNIPMSDEGKLSARSVLFLQSAKDKIDKMIERYY